MLSVRRKIYWHKWGDSYVPQQIYSMLNNADIKFPTIEDEEGNEVEITQGNFIPLMESKDRK